MAAASVRDVRNLRESQSEEQFSCQQQASHVQDDRSMAEKLYTSSERNLLEGDWENMLNIPPQRQRSSSVISDSDLDLVNTSDTRGGLLTTLRESLPYWGAEGMDSVHEAVFKALHSLNSDEVNSIDPSTGDSALSLCAQYGASDLVELLVEKSADVNHRLPSGATALHYMANSSTFSATAVDKLLKFGADPNIAEQHNGATPLHYAADSGDLETCRALVRHGADASIKDYGGYDAVGYAQGAGRADCEAFLINLKKNRSSYAIDIPVAANPEPNYVAQATSARQQKSQNSSTSSKSGAKKSGNGVLERQLNEIQEARFAMARLENDRTRIETEQKMTKLRLEAEETTARLERSERRAAAASEDAATLRAKLNMVQQTADKATSELRTAQLEATSAITSSASSSAAAIARAEELERARARAMAACEAANERAVAAELAAALAKNDVEVARRERMTAIEEAERDKARAQAAELRCEAALAAAGAEKAAATQSALESKMAAEAAGERAANIVCQRLGAESSEAASTAQEHADERAREAAERVAEITALAARTEAERDAARSEVLESRKSLDEIRVSSEKSLEMAEATRKRAEDEVTQLRKRVRELETESLRIATEIATRTSEVAAASERANRAEKRADSLDQQLLSLAQTSTVDQKLQAVEEAARTKIAELERARDEAEAAAVRNQKQDAPVFDAAAFRAVLDIHDTETSAPRLASLVKDSVTSAIEVTMRAAAAEQSNDKAKIEAVEAARADAASLRDDVLKARESLAMATARADMAESARADLNREIERLRSELANAVAQERTARAELANASNTASTEISSQRDALQAAREALKRAEDDAASARAAVRRAEDELATQREETRRLRDETEHALKRAEAESEKRLARENMEAMNATAEAKRKCDEELATARRSANAARAEAETATARVEELTARLTTAERRATDAEAELETTRRERDAANIELKQQAEAVSATQAELAQIGSLLENVRVLEQRNAQLDRDLTREAQIRKKLHNTIEDMKGKIRVLCRVRPFSEKEALAGEKSSAVVKDGQASVTVLPTRGDKKRFTFDHVFEGNTSANGQAKLFEDVRHLVTSAVDGYNVCLFAYGQTGSGKTYTIGTSANIGDSLVDGVATEDAGIAPRTACAVFEILDERSSQCESEVKISMFEVYCDKIIDLLNNEKQQPPLKITLAEHSPTGLVAVEGSQSLKTTSVTGLVKAMSRGIAARTTHATKMNLESSRSHLIMTLEVRTINRRTGAVVAGKVTLVDLAGSERVEKSGATGDRLKEATAINKSLSALGDVISSLTSGNAAHVPYRNHPLTMLMSDSVGGSAKTMMIVCSSPAASNVSETISSLNFATRCKDVTSSSNPRAAAAELSELRMEVARLRRQTVKGSHANQGGGLAGPRGPAVLALRGPGGGGLR